VGFYAEREAPPSSGAPNPPIVYSKLASFLEFCSGMKTLAKPPSFATVTRDVYPSGGAISSLTLAQAGAISLAMASAAAHLHAAGIAHGDLYAHNILLDPAFVGPAAAGGGGGRGVAGLLAGKVKLGDLGAAFFYERATRRGDLIERVEVRSWGCLVEELLALVGEEGGLGAGEAAALGAKLKEMSLLCGAEGGGVDKRPSFADIVAQLKPLVAAGE
jgi:serine/threonine protein kinase